ncbi:MAG: hypothetical protein KDD28_15220 [Phaeodactylibacter sp.]|nr:hypothetical protein [Phaeodactylibacter sp.]
MTKFQVNTDRRQYITFSQLMATANKEASAMLKKNRKVIAMAQERQKQHPTVIILAPRKLTWGECLSAAMKELYSENHVVAELDRDMVTQHVLPQVGRTERGRNAAVGSAKLPQELYWRLKQ